MYISLDSVREGTSDSLVGCPGYTKQTIDSIRNLIAVGINVGIMAVVCGPSVADFEESVQFWADMGIRSVAISPYFESQGRKADYLTLSRDQVVRLNEFVHKHNGRSNCQISLADECSSAGDTARPCAQGLSAMTILPDGRVARCEHLTTVSADTILGNLRSQSLMDAL